MNVRRIVLDVDKAIARPGIPEIAQSMESVVGVEAVNITVTEIDIETVGMVITAEGTNIDHEALIRAIEGTGAVVHSIDELAIGNRIVGYVRRVR